MRQIIPKQKKNTGKLTSEQLKKMREEDNRMVNGVFRCFEPMGGTVSFSFKKYKGDPVLNFTMRDGEIHTIPLMVAKHLNQDCWYPVHSHRMNESGVASIEVGRKVKRMSFDSLEFGDFSGSDPSGH